jgi:putative addiction module component (TIGR02574 family)
METTTRIWTMHLTIQDIDFSSLSAAERLQLAQALLDGVVASEAEPFDTEQLAELDKRVAEIDDGKAEFEPWPAVEQRLLSRR